MQTLWESDLAKLLSMLAETQTELLALLGEKRALLGAADAAGLAALVPREESLLERMRTCHERRAELLEKAGLQGLPDDSIQSLTAALGEEAGELGDEVHSAQMRSRLLQHQSLTNWVIVQRTLLHLSQMLEIIATGGRPQPTYSKGGNDASSGSLLDHAA